MRLKGKEFFGRLFALILAAVGLILSGGCAPLAAPVERALFSGAATPTSSAQPDQALSSEWNDQRVMRFEHISLEQGLSQSVVNDIVQDAQGFLWFGTQDGLNRYDGYEFKVYSGSPGEPGGLGSGSILQLLADEQGSLWVGTLNSGLNRFDPSTERFTQYTSGDGADQMLPGAINALARDASGENLWVGTSTGLARLNFASGQISRFQNEKDNPNSLSNNLVVSLASSEDGSLWVATAGGLDRLNPSTGNFTHFKHDPGDPSSLASNSIGELWVDHLGRVWVGVDNLGLDRYDPETGRFTHYRPEPGNPRRLQESSIADIYEDRAHTLWVGTSGSGLCRLEDNEQDFTCYRYDPTDPASLSNDSIASLYEDRSGVLWVGTFGAGINQANPGYRHFEHIARDPLHPDTSLGGSVVFSIYQDMDGKNRGGDVWVGMDDAGLDRIDAGTGRVIHYRHDPDNPDSLISDKVRSIYPDSSGQLWIGTDMGLDLLDPITGRFVHFMESPDPQADAILGDSVLAITEDARGQLWVGTNGGGLNRLDRSEGLDKIRFEHFMHDSSNPDSLGSNNIFALYSDRSGALWVGTLMTGLDRLDLNSGKFTHYPSLPGDPQSLSNPTVLAIFEDSRGELWVGTSGGLNRLDRETGIFERYQMKDGLPNEVVYRIEEDDQGHLWLSTNKGLSDFDPRTGVFKNYDSGDGLQSNEFNMGASIRAADGRLYFGGINGLTAFYPDQIRDNPYIPPVVLTSVTQHGEEAAFTGEELTLRWPGNYFDFDFAALNYVRAGQNQYAYRLEPLDRDWNFIGNQRTGRYTNLPGGVYSLQLKGSNNDGVWNEKATSVRIRVIPPFWETWWFRSSVVVFVFGSVAGWVGLRTRSIRAHNQKLERLVQARTVEIEKLYEQTKELAVMEERNRLARDLHDSAKQKAFAALAQLGAANSQLKGQPLRAAQSMREAETLVYEVIEELTFLIQEMYPVELNEKGLVNVLYEYLYEWEGRNEIPVDFQVHGERRLSLKLEQSLYRIVQEGLANVARHSHAGRVEVCVTYTDTQVGVSIADDGQGFDPLTRPRGVGLRSIQERIAMVGGVLNIESAPGQGTRLILSAPVRLEPDGSYPTNKTPEYLLEK